MRDIRYKIELEKLKEECKNLQICKKTSDNSMLMKSKFDEESDRNINLFKQRQKLKEFVLDFINNKGTSKLIEAHDEIKFFKKYRSFILKTKKEYPRFIFDEFDAKKFEKCVELENEGCNLTEIEDYYINVLCVNDIENSKMLKKII